MGDSICDIGSNAAERILHFCEEFLRQLPMHLLATRIMLTDTCQKHFNSLNVALGSRILNPGVKGDLFPSIA
jgi:hypothetical protein